MFAGTCFCVADQVRGAHHLCRAQGRAGGALNHVCWDVLLCS